jgi:hypothetical protein
MVNPFIFSHCKRKKVNRAGGKMRKNVSFGKKYRKRRRKNACLRIACENEMKNGRMNVLKRS